MQFIENESNKLNKLENINMSDICYKFLEENEKYFDLGQYTKDHSLMIDKLEKYSENQTCSKKFFTLLTSIYKKSKYIDIETFETVYKEAVIQLFHISRDENIVFLLPISQDYNGSLSMDKSNFYFSLYFIHLYKKITGNKLQYIYYFFTNISKDSDKYEYQVDLDDILKDMTDNKRKNETIFVTCDDYSYSGSQINSYIRNLKVNKETKIDLFLVVFGLSIKAHRTLQNFTFDYTDKNKNNNINIILPVNIYIDAYENTLEYVLDVIIREDIRKEPSIKGFNKAILNSNEYKIRYKYDIKDDMNDYKEYWKKMNDMYVIRYSEEDKKLYAQGQIDRMGKNSQTLTYLFFKYPDNVSTVPNMCFIDDYSNVYIFLYENLTLEQKILITNEQNSREHKYARYMNSLKEEDFEITKELIGEENLKYFLQYYTSPKEEQVKKKDDLNRYIKENLSNIIEICNPTLEFTDLMNCDEKVDMKNSIGLGLCNQYCWKPFYKKIVKDKPFIELKNGLSLKIGIPEVKYVNDDLDSYLPIKTGRRSFRSIPNIPPPSMNTSKSNIYIPQNIFQILPFINKSNFFKSYDGSYLGGKTIQKGNKTKINRRNKTKINRRNKTKKRRKMISRGKSTK
jgi:hypothetical protein